jgi:hypothetical protein
MHPLGAIAIMAFVGVAFAVYVVKRHSPHI